MPPETAAEKMYRKHQELRKKSGLPDPSHYKNLAAQKQKEIDAMKNENVEVLDEISTQLKTSYRQKAIADIRALRPHTQKGEYKDLAKNVMKKRQAGVNRSVKEETEKLDELSSGTLDSYVSKASRSMSRHYRTKGINKALTKSLAKAVKRPQNESAEQLDEMPESSMKTRDVHAHLKKSGWALARSSGGHDVYKHPKAKHSIPVPRHNQLKAPLIRGIMKASRVSEEAEIDEQLQQKGKFVSGPAKKPYKSSTIVSAIREAKDPREYDYEGDMAMSQLRSLVFNAEDMMDMMNENTNLPEWIQSKITLAEDYVSTAANYLRGELNEEVKDEYARKVDKYLKKKYGKDKQPQSADFAAQRRKERLAKNGRMDEDTVEEGIVGRAVGSAISKVINKLHSSNAKRPLPQASDRREYEKPKMEEFEQMDEISSDLAYRAWHKASKLSDYHSDSGGRHLAAGAYRDQANRLQAGAEKRRSVERDAANKKAVSPAKARKMNMEEVELQEGRPSQRHPLEGHDYHKKSNAELIGIAKDAHAAAEAMKGHSPQSENKYRDQANDSATVRYFRQKSGMPDWYKKKYGHVKEETEYLEEKNVPTSPEKWAQAKSQAKSKFDVYPSAYANGWAAKKYKEMGGDWKSVKEETEKPASRKAQIVKDIMKNKKNQDESTDKFQKDPEISSEIQKN